MRSQWFVIHTLSGQEQKVKESIEKRIKTDEMQDCDREVLVPMEKVVEVRNQKKTVSMRKLWPGYVFIDPATPSWCRRAARPRGGDWRMSSLKSHDMVTVDRMQRQRMNSLAESRQSPLKWTVEGSRPFDGAQDMLPADVDRLSGGLRVPGDRRVSTLCVPQ